MLTSITLAAFRAGFAKLYSALFALVTIRADRLIRRSRKSPKLKLEAA